MPQILLDIDEDTLTKVERRAALDRVSFAQWIEQNLKQSVAAAYPANFSRLCGALKDVPFELPPQGKFADGARRESV